MIGNYKAIAAALAAGAGLSAQVSDDVVRIGFLTDLSGVYSDIDGAGGVEAIKMAIAAVGGSVNGKKVELLVAVVHDMYLLQVKAPAESKYPWDYYKAGANDPRRRRFHDPGGKPLRSVEVRPAAALGRVALQMVKGLLD